MKNLLVIVLFVAFAIRPAMNVGSILYYELNIDYRVETYCINKETPELQCNGKCFLMQQNSATAQSEDAPMLLIEAFYPVYYSDIRFIDIISQEVVSIAQNWKYKSIHPRSFCKENFRPPQIS